ncbi:MAG: protein-L-isoaspartate(D-aspartate) O-methyltransferase [Gammaproteobacteria bacterium]|nr:protein-L-isoaspartate(D-aspartate) O-methyltransferase [Gammaproteobacteria bacterium]
MNSRLQGIGMTSQRTRERLVQRLQAQGIRSLPVLEAMRSTPRHIFMDEALSSRAYEDTALPIGFGQTISQPYIVARMTELLLAGGPLQKVLEVGTGSGYQTAVLAPLVGEVFTVERIRALQMRARGSLRELKISNVRFKYDDGNLGWPEHAPFDGILVTAAPVGVPPALLAQLRIGGRLVIPSSENGQQFLKLIIREEEGYQQQILDAVQFVPLLGGVQ